MIEINLSIWDHLLMLLLGVILPVFSVLQAQKNKGDAVFDTATKLSLYYSNGAALWVMTILVGIVWFVEGRSIVDLGFYNPKINLSGLFLILIFLSFYGLDIFFKTRPSNIEKTVERFKKYTPFCPVNVKELKHFTFLAFAAGFCEEVIFRAFFITYFLSLFYFSEFVFWIAIILPALIFGFSHLYQGLRTAVRIVFMAILFGLIYVITESLWIVILLHFLIDMISGLIGMKYMSEK